ncbi:BZ3500_MvSof-1268-A1-R1_Chr1-3g01649 [Microbotryum saponariae]|uniref:BZ3500_MvSof-1268-A1-R1_Chr1-3g01649 protein n=1 Tax=Microbotryum saponariae TaxID=289078 RepID=A0A2X0KUK7_9BASI|nr:BZ3500_MvSof-1268-A1-R1_Chr1-3g01649 [Microbotryum saponariae]SCZ94236.1 BZ3501_MvSof-1269-A2-R1_Chr1-3g01250 [Microbotryum saponariae]
MYTAHLLVVCHGLWGQTSHIAYICRSASEHVKALESAVGSTSARSSSKSFESTSSTQQSDEVKLVVLPAKLNEWTNTYDGIDICAERVVREIDQGVHHSQSEYFQELPILTHSVWGLTQKECERIAQDGGQVKRFSIVGYSLGGLVARYVLGLLESRSPSFFDDVKPVNFTAFASPWIGIPRYESVWSNVFRFLGARLLSRSGAQLYLTDRYLPSSLVEGNQQDATKRKSSSLRLFKTKEKAEPLLSVMADPRYSFYKALSKFERCDLYANTVNDRTVPYPTGAMETHDPFSLARAKAQKVAQERDNDDDAQIDIRDGGLEIELENDAAIIVSYRPIDAPVQPPVESKPKRRFRFRLPLLLRPTTYPFSRPVSLILIVFIPITLPATVLFLLGRFVLASGQSRRRILSERKEMGGGREGMLARVGVGLAEVAESVRADNPEYAAGLREDLSGRLSERSNGHAGKAVASASASAAYESDNDDQTGFPATLKFLGSYDGVGTPPFVRSMSPPTTASSAQERVPTDPILTAGQLDMLKHLNALPQLKKHLVFLPESRNSHGAIIARDLRFAQHKPGTKIIDSWAKNFVL